MLHNAEASSQLQSHSTDFLQYFHSEGCHKPNQPVAHSSVCSKLLISLLAVSFTWTSEVLFFPNVSPEVSCVHDSACVIIWACCVLPTLPGVTPSIIYSFVFFFRILPTSSCYLSQILFPSASISLSLLISLSLFLFPIYSDWFCS